jgi:hypothetical protein
MKMTIYNQKKDLGAIMWDMRRFGVSPAKLPNRVMGLFNRSGLPRPLLVCSLPKSGTHFIETVLCMNRRIYRPLVPTLEPRNIARFGGLRRVLSSARAGQLFVSHFPFSEEVRDTAAEAGVGVVFLKRDPRAVLSSDIRYIDTRKDHYLHPFQAACETVADRVRLQLDGVPAEAVAPFADRLEAYLQWENDPDALCLRFEDLTGFNGGPEGQLKEFELLFGFAGADASQPWLRSLPGRLPTKSTPTYRSGQGDSWRRELPAEVIAEIEARLGNILHRFGYG